MKLSFSTLGCPDWSWDEIIVAARDLNYDGIEIRGIGKEIYAPKAKPFLTSNINRTQETLKRTNIQISCITSGCILNDKDNLDNNIKEAMDYIDLAATLGVPYVRVLGDSNPHPGEVSIDFVSDNLKKIAAYAFSKNVTVLIETNGVFADSKIMRELLNRVDSSKVGVLWDIHHTVRNFAENVNETYEILGKNIKHVHIKDSIIVDGKIIYKMMGHGDLPICDAVKLLEDKGFDGFISLEWVKRWCIELEEPGVVFAHFINFMKNC